MKKNLLLPFLMLPSVLVAQTTILSDDFDAYTSGNTLAAESAGLWETWSGTGAEDPFVSNAFSSSPSNSVNVYNTAPGSYLHDVVLPFPSTYTTGTYEIRMKYYIPAGNAAYFNLGGAWVSGGGGYQYGIDVFFNNDASGNVNTGGTGVFSYTQAAWTDISVMVNLDVDSVEMFINSSSVFSDVWTPASGFGVMDIFGVGYSDATNSTETNANFYVDDVQLLYWSGVGMNDSKSEFNFNVVPNPNNGEFSINLNNLYSSNYTLTVSNVLGNNVFNQNITSGTKNLNLDLNVEAGIYMVNVSDGLKNYQKKVIIK